MTERLAIKLNLMAAVTRETIDNQIFNAATPAIISLPRSINCLPVVDHKKTAMEVPIHGHG